MTISIAIATSREYGRAKARIFENQETDDWAIIESRRSRKSGSWRDSVFSRVFSFGMTYARTTPAIWCESAMLVFDDGKRRGRIATRNSSCTGDHNLANAMAAAAAALTMEVAADRDRAGVGGIHRPAASARVRPRASGRRIDRRFEGHQCRRGGRGARGDARAGHSASRVESIRAAITGRCARRCGRKLSC